MGLEVGLRAGMDWIDLSEDREK